VNMSNVEDRRLPNWQKTEEQCNKEGWFMIDNDPRAWKNKFTQEVIDTRPKKGGK